MDNLNHLVVTDTVEQKFSKQNLVSKIIIKIK